MKESIYTIPISEVFEPRRGCPLCALQASLEERWVQYVTGAAMMEPDVRLRTNEEGFCAPHLAAMLEQRNRLSVALLLQTRLAYALEHLEDKPASGWGKKKPDPSGCFVCGRIGGELERLARNIAVVWAREESFQALFAEQEFLCHPHFQLLSQAADSLRGTDRVRFRQATAELTRRGLADAKTNIDAFCRLFDHRSSSDTRTSDQVAAAVEQAGLVLCRYTPEENRKGG